MEIMNEKITLADHLKSEGHNEDLITVVRNVAAAAAKFPQLALKSLGRKQDGSTNKTGEHRVPLDLLLDDQIHAFIEQSPVKSYASEEMALEEILVGYAPNQWRVNVDPLDGSSNFKNGLPVGTIFSVEDLQTKKIIAAGYFLYGPRTIAVITLEARLPCLYEIIGSTTFLVEKNLSIPTGGKKVYSVNEANANSWKDDRICQFINSAKKSGNFTQRYSGCMVADCHAVLMNGGFFTYPADEKYPNGKLRLNFELFPMVNIFAAAGGAGYIYDVEVEPGVNPDLHARAACVVGDVDCVRKFLALPVKK
jgi:fructose-1,6-bisphosphatase I